MTDTNTNPKSIQIYIDKMQVIGSTIASAFISADNKADKSKRELLIACAKTHADKTESIKHILEGFAAKFETEGYNANVIKQRKAEANAVFKCVALTSITNDNLTALESFEGGYHGFIQLARDINKAYHEANAVVKEGEEKAVSKVRPLTDNQLQNVEDSLKKASVTQLTQFADSVITEMNRVEQSPELAQLSQFTLIANIANSIATNDTFDKVSHDLALEVFKMVNIHINRLEAVQKKSNDILNDVMQIPAMM